MGPHFLRPVRNSIKTGPKQLTWAVLAQVGLNFASNHHECVFGSALISFHPLSSALINSQQLSLAYSLSINCLFIVYSLRISGLNAPCWTQGCTGTLTSSDGSGKYRQRGTQSQFVLECGHCHCTRRVGSQQASDPLHQQLPASMAMTGADLRKWCLVLHLIGIPLEASKGEFSRAKEAVLFCAPVHCDLQERRIRLEVVHAALHADKTTVDLAADGNADQRAHNGRYCNHPVCIVCSFSTHSQIIMYPSATYRQFCSNHPLSSHILHHPNHCPRSKHYSHSDGHLLMIGELETSRGYMVAFQTSRTSDSESAGGMEGRQVLSLLPTLEADLGVKCGRFVADGKNRKREKGSLLGCFQAQRTTKQKGDNALAMMCAIDQLPLSIAVGTGFRNVVKLVGRTYKVPVDNTIQA